MVDEGPSPLDAFLAALAKDAAANTVRPLWAYLRDFPGDDRGIATAYCGIDHRDGQLAKSEGPDANRIGRYRILKELGRGGQGAVYLAEDTGVHRTVALKVLTGRASLSEHAHDRFRREAEIASKLDHPGICPVYDVGLDGDVPFIAMKVVEGETLAKRISTARERPQLDESTHVVLPETGEEPPAASPTDTVKELPRTQADVLRIVRLVEQAARALHVAHEHGVIHRDIKPGNIMVTPGGEPVILDFGLAQDTDEEAPDLTQSGELMGTPHYMSPEQVAAHRIRLDRRTDVWSLGVALHECLTLARPFDAPTRAGIYQAILGKDPPDARALNHAISPDLKIVLETALDKDRNRRYATALDFAEDLRRVRSFEPIRARPAGPLLRLRRWCQRNPALATALGGLFVVLATGLTVALTLLGETRHQRDAKDRALSEKQAALSLVTTEKNAKQSALADYDRLGDVSRLDQLTREADDLWPATPEKLPAMRAWVRRATGLAENLPGHRDTVANLRASLALPSTDADRAADLAAHAADQATRAATADRRTKLNASLAAAESRAASRAAEPAPGSAAASPRADESPVEVRAALAKLDSELSALDAKIAERLTWRFDDRGVEFKHTTLTKLVADLTMFLDPDPHNGAMASVEQRLRFAESVTRETIGTREAIWTEAIKSIANPAECPAYRGLKITAQSGLVPIGRNRETALWEFAHLQTTAAGDDPIPERGTDGRLVINDTTGLVLVLIPGATFQMGAVRPDSDHALGSPNVDPAAQEQEAPVHAVTLAPFFMSKYEMTQGQWLRLVGRNPSHQQPGQRWGSQVVDLRNPVEQVSWDDCDLWLRRLGLVLPTEAQWEYAARAGTTSPWPSGTTKDSIATWANLADQTLKASGGPGGLTYEAWTDGFATHAPVGSLEPNAFGLHDVLGNVWEWCRDWLGNYREPVAPNDGLRLSAEHQCRVYRGGGWGNTATLTRSAMRSFSTASDRTTDKGVRPARPLDR